MKLNKNLHKDQDEEFVIKKKNKPEVNRQMECHLISLWLPISVLLDSTSHYYT